VARLTNDPEVLGGVRVFVGIGYTRAGRYQQAVTVFNDAQRVARREQVHALIAANKGRSQIALKDYEGGLMSLYEIPAFYPDYEKTYIRDIEFGTMMYFLGTGLTERGKEWITKIKANYPGTPEAKVADEELAKIQRAEKAAEDISGSLDAINEQKEKEKARAARAEGAAK
jgi:tetratricopeptide (TPR) repeat protein